MKLAQLRILPKLDRVVISSGCWTSCKGIKFCEPLYPEVTSLEIKNGNMDNILDLHKLASVFPKLQDLRVDIYLFDGMDEDLDANLGFLLEDARRFAPAKMPKLKRLDLSGDPVYMHLLGSWITKVGWSLKHLVNFTWAPASVEDADESTDMLFVDVLHKLGPALRTLRCVLHEYTPGSCASFLSLPHIIVR